MCDKGKDDKDGKGVGNFVVKRSRVVEEIKFDDYIFFEIIILGGRWVVIKVWRL